MKFFVLLAVSVVLIESCPTSTTCPAGWTAFTREKGPWCVLVTKEKLDHSGAIASCESKGAILSGIASEEERLGFQKLAKELSLNYVWLGGLRTEACMKSKLTVTCTQSNSFVWTDGTTSTEFKWRNNAPDNAQLDNPFLGLTVSNGLLEDIYTASQLNGTVCGKYA